MGENMSKLWNEVRYKLRRFYNQAEFHVFTSIRNIIGRIHMCSLGKTTEQSTLFTWWFSILSCFLVRHSISSKLGFIFRKDIILFILLDASWYINKKFTIYQLFFKHSGDTYYLEFSLPGSDQCFHHVSIWFVHSLFYSCWQFFS